MHASTEVEALPYYGPKRSKYRASRRKRSFRKALRPCILMLAEDFYAKAHVRLDFFTLWLVVNDIVDSIFDTIKSGEFSSANGVQEIDGEELIDLLHARLKETRKNEPFDFLKSITGYLPA